MTCPDFRTLLGWILLGLGPVFALKALRTTMRDMVDNINITAAEAKKHPVTLVGVHYDAVRAPKKVLSLALMMRVQNAGNDPKQMAEAIDVLILKMFGKDVAPSIKARLNDAEDDLDIDHIMALMNRLIEASAGDPTT